MATKRDHDKTQPTSRSRPKNPIAIPGEKTVAPTDEATGVRPPDVPDEREPRPEGPAVDRRTQFSGSDEAVDPCCDD